MGTIHCIRGTTTTTITSTTTTTTTTTTRVAFADVPLVLSFGPIVLKLDNTTHIPDYGSDSDDDDGDVEVVSSSSLADTATISDITSKINDMMTIMEYDGKKVNGLIR